MNEKHLVERARAGDAEAFGELFQHLRRPLLDAIQNGMGVALGQAGEPEVGLAVVFR